MKTLLLRFAAPIQGWDAGRWDVNPVAGVPTTGPLTGLYPTASGVHGLLGAALGRQRGDVEGLCDLRVLVRYDQQGRYSHEFRHSWKLNSQGKLQPRPHTTGHLHDAKFLCAVAGDDALIGECADALTHPAYPLYLGRREYPPAEPVLIGVIDSDDPEAVLRAHEWIAAQWYRDQRKDSRQSIKVEMREVRPLPRHHPRATADLTPVVMVAEKPQDPTPAHDWFAEVASRT